jgi:hypothetical protein
LQPEEFMPRAQRFSYFAAAIWFGEALFEIGRVLLGKPWPGPLPIPWHSNAIGLFLATLWTTAAAVQLARWQKPRLRTASWMVGLAATVALFFHGLVARVFGATGALLNVGFALAVGFCLIQSYRERAVVVAPVRR